jgi:hypothetical protein
MSPQPDFEDLIREREQVRRFEHYIGLGASLAILLASCFLAVPLVRACLEQFALGESATAALSIVLLLPLIIAWEWAILSRFVRNEGFNCPYCRERIEVFGPWTCGQCHYTMRLPRVFRTFFRSCPVCQNVPQYAKCPHCHVPVPLVDEPDQNRMPVCARHIDDTGLLVHPPQTYPDAVSVPDGFERKSAPPLIVAWRRARDDNLVIWWTRIGYPGFAVRGCRYAKVPTRPDAADGQPIMAPSGTMTDRIDVGVSAGRHGNFGFWLERRGFEPTGFVGFGVPPGAAASAPESPDPREERRKRNRVKLSEIEQLHREWLDEEERLAGQLERGDISQLEHDRRKEITADMYENEINALTGPERMYP